MILWTQGILYTLLHHHDLYAFMYEVAKPRNKIKKGKANTAPFLHIFFSSVVTAIIKAHSSNLCHDNDMTKHMFHVPEKNMRSTYPNARVPGIGFQKPFKFFLEKKLHHRHPISQSDSFVLSLSSTTTQREHTLKREKRHLILIYLHGSHSNEIRNWLWCYYTYLHIHLPWWWLDYTFYPFHFNKFFNFFYVAFKFQSIFAAVIK